MLHGVAADHVAEDERRRAPQAHLAVFAEAVPVHDHGEGVGKRADAIGQHQEDGADRHHRDVAICDAEQQGEAERQADDTGHHVAPIARAVRKAAHHRHGEHAHHLRRRQHESDLFAAQSLDLQ